MGEDKVFAKVAWRIIPFMGLLYLIAFLDRVNVGFAALTMNEDIGLTPEMFGLGAGLFFFIGYFLFEVPSNVILLRVGARIWICRIMLTWGAISMATALVQGPYSFYALRFLLGLAEAGFAPGVTRVPLVAGATFVTSIRRSGVATGKVWNSRSTADPA